MENIFTIRTYNANGLVDEAEADSPEGAVVAARTLNNELPVCPGRSYVEIVNNESGQQVWIGTGAELYERSR